MFSTALGKVLYLKPCWPQLYGRVNYTNGNIEVCAYIVLVGLYRISFYASDRPRLEEQAFPAQVSAGVLNVLTLRPLAYNDHVQPRTLNVRKRRQRRTIITITNWVLQRNALRTHWTEMGGYPAHADKIRRACTYTRTAFVWANPL